LREGDIEVVGVAWRDAEKLRRGDAGDCESDVIQPDGSANDGNIAAKGRLPIAIAEHGDRGGRCCVVGRLNCAAEGGSNAKSFEKAARDKFAAYDACRTVTAQIELAGSAEGDDAAEGLRLALHLLEKRIGEGAAAGIRRVSRAHMAIAKRGIIVEFGGVVGVPGEQDELLRVANGQRLEHDGIDQAKDGGVGADTESEGRHGDGGEAGSLAQHAEAVADVGEEIFEPTPAPHLTRRFLDQGFVAEFATGGVQGFLGRFAALDTCADGHFEMGTDFVLEIPIALAPEKESHASLSPFAGFKMPPMATVSRSQRERSAARCFLPAAVRR
jgi:hypothetical protein